MTTISEPTAPQLARSADGTAIAFDRTGDGPPVVLVGGAVQHRAIDSETARLAALLAPAHTVLHYDRRGRGDSGDTAPYAVAREVEDLAAVIEAAGGDGGAAVFGMSSGAALALEAARAGVPIERLALYEPPFRVDDSRAPLPAGYSDRLAAAIAEDRHGDALALFLTEAVQVPADAVAGMRRAPFWPAMASIAPTLRYDEAILDASSTGDDGLAALERYAGVTVPVLVLDGEASPVWARNAVQALAEALPAGRRSSLSDQSHQVAPDVLAPVLLAFLAER